MDWRTHWTRLRIGLAGRGTSPLLLLFGIGGGALLLVAFGTLPGRREDRVPLTADTNVTAAEFRAAQQHWQAAGLTAAQLSQGSILVPADRVDEYRRVRQPADAAPARTRWADAWQAANDRLGQFSGSRERAAAEDISRAQVIGRLLEELPDIGAADVVWDVAASTGWRTPEQARATVYLKAEPGRVIGPDVVDAVRRAVAGSKADLAVSDVTVMDQTRMLTYDGAGVTPADVQALRTVALYRSRLEAALEHIPGLRVQVLINSPASAALSAPVAVMVGIPESSIRTLARLDGAAGDTSVSAALAQRRRDVFHTVEHHLQLAIREKAATLLPAGLRLTGPQSVMIETLPGPQLPATPPASRRQTAAVAAWIRQHLFPLAALLCGTGAVWMLRPRRHRTSLPAHTIDAASPGLATAHVSPPAIEPSVPASTEIRPARIPPAVPSAPIATPAGSPQHVSDSHPPGHPWDRDASVTMTAASPAPATHHDTLQVALSKLNERAPHPDVLPAATPFRNAPPRPQTLAERLPLPRTGDRITESTDLEGLSQEPADVLRGIVRRLDVPTWTRALFGASSELQNRILPLLSPVDAGRLSNELRTNRPVRLREIDAAQAAVREVWSQQRQNLPLATGSPARTAGDRSAA